MKTNNTWLRRTFDLNKIGANIILLKFNHNDNSKVYINGQSLDKKTGWTDQYDNIPVDKELLKTGKNVLAIHMVNSAIGSWLGIDLVEEVAKGQVVPDAKQKSINFNTTETIYEFACGGIHLNVTFTSPLPMDDLNLLIRPVSYISTKVNSRPFGTQCKLIYKSNYGIKLLCNDGGYAWKEGSC